MTRPLRVVVFCGGRGSSSILRELLRREMVELTLLINAYDDGFSTGALRRLIPGMLGPSDFRKNLSLLLGLHSREQFELVRILEHRLSRGTSLAELSRVSRRLSQGDAAGPGELGGLFARLDRPLRESLGRHLRSFAEYAAQAEPAFDLADCALGNLLFAGAYLRSGRSFHEAVRELTRQMGCEASLLDVTSGENRVLVALKADGQILGSEAEIVGPQSAVPIVGLYLLPAALTSDDHASLSRLPIEERKRALERREAAVTLSTEAGTAIARADLLIYGPGTQFSSLLPSYKTLGLREAIAASPARVKAFVVNLRHDHDIQSLGAVDVVDNALRTLGDPDNAGPSITHVLASQRLGRGPDPGGAGPDGDHHRGARWLQRHLENDGKPGIHNGHTTVSVLLDLCRDARASPKDSLEIYVDLRERSLAAPLVVEELSELDWGGQLGRVVLTLNGAGALPSSLPPPWEIRVTARGSLFSEADVLREWLAWGDSDYLVTLAGDGEYRLSDVAVAVDVLRRGPFGAVFGSRNQSRRQMRGSLAYAYGESRALYWGSWLGAYVFSGLFAVRFGFQSSDPFTAFRVYRRSAFEGVVAPAAEEVESATAVSRWLLRAGIEIAEIPVYHRTFKGFTNVRTRLARGLRNAVDTLR